MKRTALLLLAGLATAAAAPAPAAFAGGISEYPFRDWENGWSMKTILGWDTRPPSMPGTSESGRVAAGWYPRGTDDETWCSVVVLGRYFDEAIPQAGAAAAAPEKFPKWLEGWFETLRARVKFSKVTGKGQACRLGPDPGWMYEGEYEVPTQWRSSIPPYETVHSTDNWKIFAVGARRGDFEVGTVFFFQYRTYRPEPNLKLVRESAMSLRFLDAKDMARRRDELDTKAKKAGDSDEAWIVRVRAKIPEGWRYFRRADTVYIHPDAIPGTTVETLALRLDSMRKKGYPKLFPATIDRDAPPAVVKITRDKRQYLAYGAPEGSLGYFSARERELVLFYQAADWWDRIDSTAVLFHEGFHQYLNQALDGLSAHPWFEEGFADYFGGWKLFEGNPRPGELVARRRDMDDVLEDDAWIPMGRFLGMEWDAFYGKGPDAVNPGIAYAQAWSFATFLRSGKNSVLADRYYAALLDGVAKWKTAEAARAAEAGRPARSAGAMPRTDAEALRAKALATAFQGVDPGDLEQAWLDWLTK